MKLSKAYTEYEVVISGSNFTFLIPEKSKRIFEINICYLSELNELTTGTAEWLVLKLRGQII